jgi:CRISPR/Cas system-associated exonuclease Cas4 (RecB family)
LTRRAITCNSYAGFQSEIAAFLKTDRDGELLVMAATRGAAEDAVWACAPAGALGVHRFTPAGAAAVVAAGTVADRGLKIANRLASEAVAARVAHELREKRAWRYFGPVANSPGFPRALASTLGELRLNGVEAWQLKGGGAPAQDLSAALELYTGRLRAGSLADLADLYALAIEQMFGGGDRFCGLPFLLLDVALGSELEREFVSALAHKSPRVLACSLAADREASEFWQRLLGAETCVVEDEAQLTTVGRVRRWIFSSTQPQSEKLDETLDYFSASGEALECVEIARRILRLGIPFDRVAVLLRAPERYQPLLEEALRRAEIPAHFSRGVVRPDAAGRAFLALLECGLENCSASRFAEYLSLGQVPVVGERGEEPVQSDDDIQQSLRAGEAGPKSGVQVESLPHNDSDAVIEGTLQAPVQWERLLIDASVIGGADRWERRLRALENEIRLKLETAEGNAADEAHYQRELTRLANLEAFALPLIRRLTELPDSTSWGEWLPRLRDLSRAALRRPDSVLAVLDELEPMADVGPAGLREVAMVLSDRLRFLRREPPARRGGAVFVAGIDEARGRVFDAVFLPGLAEGGFPRKVAEDPLLLDDARKGISEGLATNHRRREHERLLLSIAAGAAANRFTFSYPRIDLGQSRPRVPSFYALELIRAANGYLPELRAFQEDAARRAESRLDRFAPMDFAEAIDDAEYDLVALERALELKGAQQLGAMSYLTRVNETLARSLRARYSRWEVKKKFTAYDGLLNTDRDLGDVLPAYRLTARPYSPTALQTFAACPYRFALHGMMGLRPRDEIQPLHQMDPLTRGALFHEAQRRFFEQAKEKRLLPLDAWKIDACRECLDSALNQTAAEYHERLAPAIARVWAAELEDIRSDLHGWLQQIVSTPEWMPEHFELAFGLAETEGRDPQSKPEPVVLENGAKVRGSIDLLERHMSRGVLRVVDHKTGKAPRTGYLVVGGGQVLQPLLYALAAEQRVGATVECGRLFYCTQRGNYQALEVELSAENRRQALRVLETIDRAVAAGDLPAAPAQNACALCDYRSVCGPHEQMRWRRKNAAVDELQDVRNMP